jgi:nitrate reductase NapAB chaperone NapD
MPFVRYEKEGKQLGKFIPVCDTNRAWQRLYVVVNMPAERKAMLEADLTQIEALETIVTKTY